MISRTKWHINGHAIKIKQRKRGCWITAEGILSNGCISEQKILDCWLPISIDDKRRNYLKKFNASGVLVFEGNDTYFLTEELL